MGKIISIIKYMANYNSPANIQNDRNEAIIFDYIKSAGQKKGKRIFKYSMLDLISKYKISATRIYQIMKSYGVPKRIKS